MSTTHKDDVSYNPELSARIWNWIFFFCIKPIFDVPCTLLDWWSKVLDVGRHIFDFEDTDTSMSVGIYNKVNTWSSFVYL